VGIDQKTVSAPATSRGGPLAGLRIIELAGIGPGPMCAMLLADLGATVLRIDRKEPSDLGLRRPLQYNLLLRNRKTIALDLKDPRAVEAVLGLVARADALIEGFRPGVTERLGLGPEDCLRQNPRLVYGRMTGWGQSGPLAQTAGHDIGYIAITGVLHAIGRQDAPPAVPLNLIGDYAGGSLYLALGLLAGILEARASGKGQVVDAAIVDGTASLATTFFGMHAAGMLNPRRGTNATDSGSHFYDVYECADGEWISVGPIEPKFYALLLQRLQLDAADLGPQMDPATWPRAKALLAAKFRERTRDEWAREFATSDACVAPVLRWDEAPSHPHLAARGTFVEVEGVVQPAPAPRFSRTPPATPTSPAPVTPENTRAALSEWLSPAEIGSWQAAGLIEEPV
jgi:crotonobetainyl-CoA:carnitine CoA-transferase CaiB-like acyl-CoA transferase